MKQVLINMSKETFWVDKNVLITGCTGLLGSWLTESLVSKKANVIGLVRDSVPKSKFYQPEIFNHVVAVRGEIENYAILERILNEYEINTVFHLAAQTIVTLANRNPISTFKSNIEGTWNILEACRRAPWFHELLLHPVIKRMGINRHYPMMRKPLLKEDIHMMYQKVARI